KKVELLDSGVVVATSENDVINTTIALGAGAHRLQLRASDAQGLSGLSNISNIGVTTVRPSPFAELKLISNGPQDPNPTTVRGRTAVAYVGGRGIGAGSKIV